MFFAFISYWIYCVTFIHISCYIVLTLSSSLIMTITNFSFKFQFQIFSSNFQLNLLHYSLSFPSVEEPAEEERQAPLYERRKGWTPPIAIAKSQITQF